MQEGGGLMITTLKPTTEQRLHATGVGASVAPMTASTAREVSEGRGSEGLPIAIGVLVGLLVVLAVAVWAYLVLSDADYSGVIDLTRSLAP
jgi:hypothetical protein